MNLGPSDCYLEVQTREDAILARFTQPVSLCAELAEAASEQLLALLSDEDHKRLLVDFSNVESLTSFMIGQLVMLNRTAEAAGWRFALFNLPLHIREVLDVARLDLLLTMYPDESAALCG